jgi:N-hydroxyarylamine O-acetyltransferase
LAIDAPRPAIHTLLKVELPEGNYLADVGFGRRQPWVMSGHYQRVSAS